jgi:DNA polymerase-3 subunit epsilon
MRIQPTLRAPNVTQSGHGTAGAAFAVVDVETTGLYPSVDRVVEVAVVLLGAGLEVVGEFCTLVDPRRDVGPTRLHGVRARDVVGAPDFAEVAPVVWGMLSGRVLVAHNASFDARFLDAEFARCGLRLPPPPVMCTMALASYYLRGLPGRSLAACCAAAGVKLTDHHSALADARAAASLLSCYGSAHHGLPDSWIAAILEAAAVTWRSVPPSAAFRPVTRAEQILRQAGHRPPLAGLVDRLPRGEGGDLDAYLGVLDRVLEDRIVTDSEISALASLADELGLARGTAEHAHREYLGHLAAAAWQDRIVTDAERTDLLEVAGLLDVPAVEALAILDRARDGREPSQVARPDSLRPGDRVVLTGDLTIPRAQVEAMATVAGLRVTGSVSAKTALVVAADPHSQSGKARQAREHGVRMVTEQVFLHMLSDLQRQSVPAATAGETRRGLTKIAI